MSGNRPRTVQAALVLIVALLVVYLLTVARRASQEDMWTGLAAATVLMVLLYEISQRKNWARWTYVLLQLINGVLLLWWYETGRIVGHWSLGALLNVLAVLTSCVLLLTPSASAWFSDSTDEERPVWHPHRNLAGPS